MKRVIHTAYTLAALLVLTLAISDTANAGQRYLLNGQCFALSGTLTACYGNMADIAAQTTDTTEYATFEKYTYDATTTTLSFGMQYNNQYYYCYAPSSMLDTWNTLLVNAKRGFFMVEIDNSSGTCVMASAAMSSSYD